MLKDAPPPEEALAEFLRAAGCRATACGAIEEAVSRAYERARPDGMVCCLGSLYMAGAARAAAGRLKRCV